MFLWPPKPSPLEACGTSRASLTCCERLIDEASPTSGGLGDRMLKLGIYDTSRVGGQTRGHVLNIKGISTSSCESRDYFANRQCFEISVRQTTGQHLVEGLLEVHCYVIFVQKPS